MKKLNQNPNIEPEAPHPQPSERERSLMLLNFADSCEITYSFKNNHPTASTTLTGAHALSPPSDIPLKLTPHQIFFPIRGMETTFGIS